MKLDRSVRELAQGKPVLDIERLREADWVLTTYETLRDYQHSFGRVLWEVIVFDETQKIKNPAAAMTDAAKCMQAEFQLALTGTPVENRLADIWCIIDTVRSGWLGSLADFSKEYEGGDDPAAAAQRLSSRLAEEEPPPAMLRRLKRDHLDGLPAITVHRYPLLMPLEQAAAYEEIVAMARSHEASTLEALGRLRRVSLHPRDFDGGAPAAYIDGSARLRSCVDVLHDVARRDEKALVFVESRAMQVALVDLLPRLFDLGDAPMVINGAIPAKARQARVDRFQTHRGFDIMLISPKAGGVGLTLTAANHVVHLSRWWNPAVEDQCTDRVYRIGQDSEVHVHIPIAEHPEFGIASFDHQLDLLLSRKRALSRAALAPVAFTEGDAESLLGSVVGQG